MRLRWGWNWQLPRTLAHFRVTRSCRGQLLHRAALPTVRPQPLSLQGSFSGLRGLAQPLSRQLGNGWNWHARPCVTRLWIKDPVSSSCGTAEVVRTWELRGCSVLVTLALFCPSPLTTPPSLIHYPALYLGSCYHLPSLCCKV
jgi:hypothetical protein